MTGEAGSGPKPTNQAPSAIRFDRNEFSGAFGDFGTDFPLIVGMILVSGLDAASVLIMFGLMQLLTGLAYRLPMPVQPLKAVAVIAITQGVTGNVLYAGGLVIGLIMLFLTFTRLLDWVGRVVPQSVVRGIQLGLGLQLALLALGVYVQSNGPAGYVLAAIGVAITLPLLGNRRFPPAPFLVVIGVVFAVLLGPGLGPTPPAFGLRLPIPRVPSLEDMLVGLVLLALPQIPLSIGNSVLATQQVVRDLYPDRPVSLRKVGLTYSLMNLVNPFLTGIPTCHGSGGMAGHYAFGARTGGSVVIEGTIYMLVGLFVSRGFETFVTVFPLPILGVILFFESLTLMLFIRDVFPSKADASVVLLVGLFAAALPYGYVVGLIVGTAVAHAGRKGLLRFAK